MAVTSPPSYKRNGLLFLEIGGVAVPEGGVLGDVLVVGAAFKGGGGVHVDAGGDEFHVAGNVVALFFIGVGDVDATQEVDGAKAFVGGGNLGGDFTLWFFVDGNQLPAERGKIAGGDVYHVFEDGKVAEVDIYLTGIGGDGRSAGGGKGRFFKGIGDDLHRIALVKDAPFVRQFIIAGIDDVKDIAGVAHHVGEQDVVEAGKAVEDGTGLLAAAHFVVFVVDFTESGFRVGTVVAFGVIDGDGGFLGAGVTGNVGGVFEIAFVVEGHGDVVVVDVGNDVAEHFFVDEELPVNVDFADVETTMSNSGVALMGFATATVGIDNIATTLTEEALLSPLLSQNNINGAKNLLVNISWKDKELKMSEVYAIIGHVQAAAGDSASLIWGAGYDETLEDGKVSVVIVATGFEQRNMQGECEKDMWLENIMVKPKEEPGDETPAPEVVIDNTPAVQPANIVTPTPERPAEQPTAPQKVVVSWDDTPVDEGKESQEPDDDDFALVDDLQRAHNEIYREKMAASVSPMAHKNVGNGERTFLSLDDEDVKEEPKKSNDDDMLSMEVKNMPIGSTSPMGMPAGFSPDNASQEQTSVRRNLFSEQQIDAPAPDMRRSSPEPFRRHVNDPFDMEQMENTPAYLRRNMLITPNPSAKKKVEKLNIKLNINNEVAILLYSFDLSLLLS